MGEVTRQVVLDTETTGLEASKGHRPDVPAEWREQAAPSKRRQKKEGQKNKDKRARAHARSSAWPSGIAPIHA